MTGAQVQVSVKVVRAHAPKETFIHVSRYQRILMLLLRRAPLAVMVIVEMA